MGAARSSAIATACAVAMCAVATHPLAQTALPSAEPAASSAPAASQATAPPPARSAPTASSERDPSMGPVQTQPFGPGLAVQLECDKPYVYAYVAKGVLDDRPVFPDPFVKVGRLPLTIELPPGTYTVIAEGDSVPTATRVFQVDRLPVHVKVKGGSQGLRDGGTLLTALGGVALLAGVVFEFSGASDQDNSKKQKIAIPLFIAGGVGFAGGLTMFLVSKTSITDDGPAEPREGDHARQTFHGLSLGGTF